MDQRILKDQLRISLEFRPGGDSVETFRKVFHIFEGSFVPEPTLIDMPNTVKYPVDGFSDPFILETLRHEAETSHQPFQLLREGIDNIQVISPLSGMSSLTEHRLLPTDYASAARALMSHLITEINPLFLCCCFDQVSRQIYRKHFQWLDRTHRSPNLVWFQYYSGAELEAQGGRAVLVNPHAKTAQLGDGVTIEVGDSPEDVCTPEGEDLIVKATNAMPKIS